jgi:hypothetical protein
MYEIKLNIIADKIMDRSIWMSIIVNHNVNVETLSQYPSRSKMKKLLEIRLVNISKFKIMNYVLLNKSLIKMWLNSTKLLEIILYNYALFCVWRSKKNI